MCARVVVDEGKHDQALLCWLVFTACSMTFSAQVSRLTYALLQLQCTHMDMNGHAN